ncbi:cyanophycin synthetase [Hydrogenophaga electricum]|uniref:Cyanophycin synthetase n=1 Tax=Hydrogenophaga electricum TaxID=1230953 RepID=A0ABQ6CAB1_9BURK|nr:cyanophycin synthetase [Hydrogenophaga electricum]GLS16744.1 cyanophycin synthetase [Hydrogenophaga electricum]
MPLATTEIQLLRVTYLRGPNIWTFRPVLEVWLDLGPLEDYPSNRIPGLSDRLVALLPALVEHHCGVGERGGFLQRLHEGTWAGHILEHCVIELLNLAGMPTGFGQTRSTTRHGVYRMVFRARDEQVARVALAQAHALLTAAIRDQAFDVAAAVRAVRDAIDDSYLGPSTACIVAAATDRQIPHIRLNDGNLVQLGYGARQRRIWTAETDRTGAIAEGVAGDKDLTKTLLQAVGVPVPEGQAVTSAAAAWEAACDIGLPVAVKPSDGNHGRGVTLDLREQADVEAAFALADRHGSEVLVERCIPGNEHRLLVVGGEMVAAARGESAWITGDGRHTVAELLDLQINTDPRRGTTEDHPLNRLDIAEDGVIRLDLQRQGLSPETVPAAGRRILIQRNGNVAIDCTDDVHPEVAYLAGLAARTVGLDIAGIDLVAEDIGRPLHEQGGAVVEVNAGPGLLMHLKPAIGQPRPVGQAIVEHLFPTSEDDDDNDPNPGRIPVVGVAGTRATPLVARAIAWLTRLSGLSTGLACADGIFLGQRRIEAPGPALARDYWSASHRLLMNRNLRAAVFENGPGLILDDGLPYDRCLIGVVTDFDGWPDLARHDVSGIGAMRKVMRTQIDVVLPEGVGVLNGDDEWVADLAELCDGEVLFYGRTGAQGPAKVITSHLERGGRAALMDAQGLVQLAGSQGSEPITPIDVAGLLARHGRADEPALADALLVAIAAAWGFGIAPELVAAGLETFVLHLPR